MRRWTGLFFWIGVAVFLASFYWLSRVYAHLVVAFVLAYMLEPLVSKLEARRVPRVLGDAAVLAGFFLILAGFVVVAAPLLIEQARDLTRRAPTLLMTAEGFLVKVSSSATAQKILSFFPPVDSLFDFLPTPASPETVFSHLLRSTVGVLTSILGLFVIPLMSFHLLRDFPQLSKRFLRFVPHRHQRAAREIQDRLDSVLGGFLRGQLLVSSLLSLYYVLAFLILKLDLGLVLGVMAGFLNLIPYLGILATIILVFLVALLHGATVGKLLALGIVFATGMVGEGMFLTPKIVGDRVGLSPLSVLVALMIFGELFGIAGMLIAIPVFASIKVVVDYGLERWAEQKT